MKDDICAYLGVKDLLDQVKSKSGLCEREFLEVLAHTRKAEDTVVHDDVDSRGNEPCGKEYLGDVLQGVGVAKLIRPHCAGEDHWNKEVTQLTMEKLAGLHQGIGSVKNHHRVRACKRLLRGLKNAHSVVLCHLEGVLQHDLLVGHFKVGETKSGKHLR